MPFPCLRCAEGRRSRRIEPPDARRVPQGYVESRSHDSSLDDDHKSLDDDHKLPDGRQRGAGQNPF